MWVKRGCGFVLGVVLPLGWSAAGATVDLQLNSVNPGLSERVSFNSGGSYKFTGTGNFNFTVINDPDPVVNSQIITTSNLVAYCMEGTQPATFGVTETYTVVGPNPAIPNGALLTAFFNQYYNSVISLNNDQASAAFQLDLWELLNDGLTNAPLGTDVNSSRYFTDGAFRVFAPAGVGPTGVNYAAPEVQLAESWLDGFNTSTTGSLFLYQLSNPDTQDFVFGVASDGAIPTQTSTETPLPAALPGGAALIAALGGLGAFKKFRRRGA